MLVVGFVGLQKQGDTESPADGRDANLHTSLAADRSVAAGHKRRTTSRVLYVTGMAAPDFLKYASIAVDETLRPRQMIEHADETLGPAVAGAGAEPACL